MSSFVFDNSRLSNITLKSIFSLEASTLSLVGQEEDHIVFPTTTPHNDSFSVVPNFPQAKSFQEQILQSISHKSLQENPKKRHFSQINFCRFFPLHRHKNYCHHIKMNYFMLLFIGNETQAKHIQQIYL